MVVVIVVIVGDDGCLFGLIFVRDIVEVLIIVGVEVVKFEVCLGEGLFCVIGEY